MFHFLAENKKDNSNSRTQGHDIQRFRIKENFGWRLIPVEDICTKNEVFY